MMMMMMMDNIYSALNNVSDAVLSTLQGLLHLTLMKTLCGRYHYYLHLTFLKKLKRD